jgi:hypothetical protein
LALKESSSKARSFAFYEGKKASSMKQADHKDMFKRSPSVSVHQPLSYLQTSFLLFNQLLLLRRLQKTQNKTDDFGPADVGDI